jgi:hypothetical protein
MLSGTVIFGKNTFSSINKHYLSIIGNLGVTVFSVVLFIYLSFSKERDFRDYFLSIFLCLFLIYDLITYFYPHMYYRFKKIDKRTNYWGQ